MQEKEKMLHVTSCMLQVNEKYLDGSQETCIVHLASCIAAAHTASNLLQLLQNGKVNSRNTKGRATQSSWSGLSMNFRLLY